MHFIDNEYLVPVARRRDCDAVDNDFARVLDLGVSSGVDFLNVNRSRCRDVQTGRARIAWLGGDPFCAVQCFGKYSRCSRLTHAASAGEQVSVMEPPGLDRVHQRARDRFLSDDLIEGLRSELSSYYVGV